MLAMGQRAPLPFATDHYRPWPDDLPPIRPLVRRTGPRSQMPRPRPPFRSCRRRLSPGGRRPGARSSSPITAPTRGAAGRRWPRQRRAPSSACRRTGRSPSMPGGSTRRRGSTSSSRSPHLRPEILFLLVGSEGEGPIEAEAAAARQCPDRALAGAGGACPPGCGGRRAADPALARAARAVSQLRAAAEALRLSRRRPADPRARRARHRRIARPTARTPCSCRRAGRRRPPPRSTGCSASPASPAGCRAMRWRVAAGPDLGQPRRKDRGLPRSAAQRSE